MESDLLLFFVCDYVCYFVHLFVNLKSRKEKFKYVIFKPNLLKNASSFFFFFFFMILNQT